MMRKKGEKKVASTLCESEKSDVCMFAVDFPRVWANECSEAFRVLRPLNEFLAETNLIRKSVRNLWLYSFVGITEKKNAGKMGKNW